MKPEYLTNLVLDKLGFFEPLDYDVKPDGELVVLDRSCQKYKFSRRDYENLLEDTQQQHVKVAGRPPLRSASGGRRGRKPKVD